MFNVGEYRAVTDAENITLHRFPGDLRVYSAYPASNNAHSALVSKTRPGSEGERDIFPDAKDTTQTSEMGGWKKVAGGRGGVSLFVPFDEDRNGAWRYAHERVAEIAHATPGSSCAVSSPATSAVDGTALFYDRDISHPVHGPVAFHILRHPSAPMPIQTLQQIALCQQPVGAWTPCQFAAAAESPTEIPDDFGHLESSSILAACQRLLYDLMYCDEIPLASRFEAALYEYILSTTPEFYGTQKPVGLFLHDKCRISELLLLSIAHIPQGQRSQVDDSAEWECNNALRSSIF